MCLTYRALPPLLTRIMTNRERFGYFGIHIWNIRLEMVEVGFYFCALVLCAMTLPRCKCDVEREPVHLTAFGKFLHHVPHNLNLFQPVDFLQLYQLLINKKIHTQARQHETTQLKGRRMGRGMFSYTIQVLHTIKPSEPKIIR